jgi:predicted AAA+ superfamily ATPase
VALSTLDSDTLKREMAPLAAINDSNQKYLLTTDFDDDPVYDGIRKLNVVRWMTGKS